MSIAHDGKIIYDYIQNMSFPKDFPGDVFTRNALLKTQFKKINSLCPLKCSWAFNL